MCRILRNRRRLPCVREIHTSALRWLYFLKRTLAVIHNAGWLTNSFIIAMESSFPLAVSVSLVVNVILGVVFSSMYIFVYPGLFNTKKNPYEEKLVSPSSSLCLSCEYLSPSDYDLYSEVVTTAAGHRLCCHSEDGELADFFALVYIHWNTPTGKHASNIILILFKINWLCIVCITGRRAQKSKRFGLNLSSIFDHW